MEYPSTECQLFLAVQAIEKDLSFTVEVAAKIYSVSRTTAQRRLQGVASTRDSPPKSNKLTELEEKTIIKYDLDLDSREVSSRFQRNYKRAQCKDPDIIRGWLALVRNSVVKYGIAESDIYNFDKTGFMHFDKHTKPRTTGAYRLLILDGHQSHHLTDFELYCKDNNIITLCMPPHSSHILQPLDVGCFGPLKQAYGLQIEKKMRAGTSHITKERVFLAAFQAAMTEKDIQGGFRGTGLVPF
ncbi:transposase [Verticillium dahliae]